MLTHSICLASFSALQVIVRVTGAYSSVRQERSNACSKHNSCESNVDRKVSRPEYTLLRVVV